jgi:hypothetical protein
VVSITPTVCLHRSNHAANLDDVPFGVSGKRVGGTSSTI